MSGGDVAVVTGSFADEESCVRGVVEVRAAGFDRPIVYSPFPSHEILHAVGRRPSPIRLWVLCGGLAGVASGFALTIGLSTAWYPRVVGGMPYASLPPFVVIAFEMMILFGALVGATGFFFHGDFPRTEAGPGFDPRFTDDRFGVVVVCPETRAAEAESRLRNAGAEEVTRGEP